VTTNQVYIGVSLTLARAVAVTPLTTPTSRSGDSVVLFGPIPTVPQVAAAGRDAGTG
jgi:hypothetical protein